MSPGRATTTTLSGPARALGDLLTPTRRRALRHGLILGGVLAAVVVVVLGSQGTDIDAYAYWANRPPVSYGAAPGTEGAYLYSPAFAQSIALLTALPWGVFLLLWRAVLVGALAWLVGPWLLLPAVLLLGIEIHYANVNLLIAVALVVGFRYAWTWAFVLLTKVTPGLGLLWFLRRREWRSLLIAMGVTGAIVAVSLILDPQGWVGWINLLAQSASPPGQTLTALTPLWLRLPVAAGLVWWAAGRDARWIMPVAAAIAMPIIWLGATLALLAAVVPLLDNPRLRPGWRSALA